MFTAFNLLLVVFLVLANGFFVASEFSLVGVRPSRIATLAASGNKGAHTVDRVTRRRIRSIRLVLSAQASSTATMLLRLNVNCPPTSRIPS